ncbi:uncharacterized protein LOC106666341 isoform X2 [Cimex lectularius]|uniref:Uncharacterized protein n=1 Tax=Cimex lectularius TaxID=79782 RepID=A0A8I6SHE7_CIMLE|nr:uncharacterized protein LOC106666341 isoform X2 [Cimex lectularius]
MNIDVILKPKSCCFCLSLRTGCYMIATVYLLVSLLFFLAELTFAVFRFSRSLNEQSLAVIFAYDLNPTISALFSMFYIYGLFKQNKTFIFYGIPLVSLSLFMDVFSILVILIKWAVGYKYVGFVFLLDLSIYTVIETFFFIIVFNYYNQFVRVNKPAERLPNVASTNDFHEVENPNFTLH